MRLMSFIPLLGFALIVGGFGMSLEGCWSYVSPYKEGATYEETKGGVPTGRTVSGKEANREARQGLGGAILFMVAGAGVAAFGLWLDKVNEQARRSRGL